MMKTIKTFKLLIASGLMAGVSAFSASTSFADDIDAIIDNRKDVMQTIRKTAGALNDSVKGGASQTDLIAAATAFVEATNTEITIAAFETNTHGKGNVKTTSTEKVWTDWERFSQALTDMNSGAIEIKELAEAGTLTSADQMGIAMKECGFCHRQAGYRGR